ncbi:MAG: phenylacetate--CoA ligase family protein, partial [Rhodobacteraceae bacterium]|nr:phenylacetate--CoA ligase family protein [Paracoccaceae bacterium]
GTPVHAWATDISQLFTTAFTLRDHCWHRRDLSARLAVIHTLADGRTGANWGAGTAGIFQTGPVVTMNIRNDIATQADWLARQEPVYLLSHPSNIRELARYCLEQEITLPTLGEVVTFGELLVAETRDLARRAWDLEIKDVYSSEESGTMALQCPEREHYHVQAEGYYLEVLHGDGRPCAPGETGQVVVTALHNLAMPLIRYAIGDYAEVGEDCPCGRGLPVLKRILGRSRNMLTLPDGTRHWPSFPTRTWLKIAPIRQLQLEQDRPDHIQVRLVADAPLSTHQQSQLIDVLRESLGYPFNITLELLEQIPRTANAKFEDFISRIDV